MAWLDDDEGICHIWRHGVGRHFGSSDFCKYVRNFREFTDAGLEQALHFYGLAQARTRNAQGMHGDITLVEVRDKLGSHARYLDTGQQNQCQRTGNHLGIQPHTFKDNIEFLCEELEDDVGIHVDPVINKKGAEILFIIPSVLVSISFAPGFWWSRRLPRWTYLKCFTALVT